MKVKELISRLRQHNPNDDIDLKVEYRDNRNFPWVVDVKDIKEFDDKDLDYVRFTIVIDPLDKSSQI